MWIVRYTRQGKRTTKTIGKHGRGGLTEREALAVVAEFRKSLVHVKPTPDITLAGFLELHRDEHRENAPASHDGTYRQFAHVAEFFGVKRMGAISQADANRLKTHLLATGWTRKLHPNTVRQYVSKLRTLWAAAIEQGVVNDNPWASVRIRKAQDKPVNALNAAEVDALVLACPGHLTGFVRVLAETGLRRGEALALEWRDVRNGRLTVQKSKTRAGRTFVLSKRAVIAFEKIEGMRKGRVFGGLMDTKAAQRRELDAIGKASVQAVGTRLTFHSLRHSLGYRMAAAGATEVEIAGVLGHAQLVTTRRYIAHHPDATAARAVGKLDAAESQDDSSRAKAAASKRPPRQTR